MANSLYFQYSPSFATSNTKRMTSVKAINPDNLDLFDDEANKHFSKTDLFDDPAQIIPGDVIGKDVDDANIMESMNYTPDIGNMGNPFGSDEAGSNVGDDGRIEHEIDSLLDDVPETPIVHAQRVTSLITGPEQDELDDSDVYDKSLFEMYQSYADYVNSQDLNENIEITGTYGIPRLKRYPLNNEKEIKRAINQFKNISNPKDKKTFVANLLHAIDEKDLDITIPRSNPLYDYVPERMRQLQMNEGIEFLMDEGVLKSAKLTSDWMRSTKVKNKKTATLPYVSETEYNKIKALVQAMREEDDYKKYHRMFIRFCKIFHIPYNGTIVCDHIEKKNKMGTYTLSITWSNNTNKITLPEGYSLYHVSPVAGIKELIPTFKGKKQKGYLYDKPRIYFSIKKHMPKFNADLVGKDAMGTHQYVAKKEIREVYVDPIVWAPFYGAVYIETNQPVPVEEVNLKPQTSEQKQQADEAKNESILNFIYENGLEVCVDDVDTTINEGILNVVTQQFKKFKDFAELKAFWNKKQKLFRSNVWDEREVSDEDFEMYKQCYETLCKPDVKYGDYKRAFMKLCRLFGVYYDSTILETLRFTEDKKTGKKKIICRYSTGVVKVKLPDEVELKHVSPASDIDKLNPTYRSKTTGRFFYPNPRVYFTIKKQIAANKAGLEGAKLTSYKPKERIDTCYIDPTYTKISDGAVFVPTTSPIPVVRSDANKKGGGGSWIHGKK